MTIRTKLLNLVQVLMVSSCAWPSTTIAAGLAGELAPLQRPDLANAKLVLDNVEYVNDAWDAIDGASAAVLVTEWDAFRGLDLKVMNDKLASPVLVDLRNVFDRAAAESAGLVYHAVGR